MQYCDIYFNYITTKKDIACGRDKRQKTNNCRGDHRGLKGKYN